MIEIPKNEPKKPLADEEDEKDDLRGPEDDCFWDLENFHKEAGGPPASYAGTPLKTNHDYFWGEQRPPEFQDAAKPDNKNSQNQLMTKI